MPGAAAASQLGLPSDETARRAIANRHSPRGNPPSLTTRGFLPREKRREAGYGGLPKSANIWPRGEWPEGNVGIPAGKRAAKVAFKVIFE
jgi:hypothetical protein